MKLSKFNTLTKSNEGIEIELVDIATGEGSGAFIKVLGTDSKKFKDTNADRARQALERIRNKVEQTKQEQEDEAAFLLASCTVGWRGLEGDEGEEFPFSEAAALDLYKQYPLIREQVDRAIADRSRFILG